MCTGGDAAAATENGSPRAMLWVRMFMCGRSPRVQVRVQETIHHGFVTVDTWPRNRHMLPRVGPSAPWRAALRRFVGRRGLCTAAAQAAQQAQLLAQLSDVPPSRIRNFCIVAHVECLHCLRTRAPCFALGRAVG